MPNYESLSDYITARAREIGYNSVSLSEALGFGRSYINAVIHGQFLPSRSRCQQIAEFFGDSPNIILRLAGYYQPLPDEDDVILRVADIASSLPENLRGDLLDYAEYLRSKHARAIRESDND
jgi:hypothetical protein